MTEQALNIPPNWVEIKLGNIIELAYGKNLPKEKRNTDGKYPVYGSNGIVGYHDQYLITGPAIIVGRKGAAGIPTYAKEDCWPIDTTYFIQPKDAYDLQFVYHLIKHLRLDRFDRSTAIPGLNRDDAYALNIGLPPLNEQKRIVAKIEELFSELDKGIESLKTAREQLKVYRQAVLKHAFEGKLTARWREQNKSKLEAANQLLSRIQTCGGNHSAFNLQNATGLPEIPFEWLYTRLGNVGDLGRGKSKHRPRNDKKLFGGKYPFIQTGEVKAANRIVREYSQTYSDFGLQQSKLWPAGTLCITIAANIAETAFLGFDACFPDSIVGFTPIVDLILPEYVELFIKSVRARIEAYAPATAQKNINLTTLENLVVPLCSLEEQKEIVKQVEAIFTRIDNCESEIEINLQKSEALRQSILKKAFSGKLVAQDPNDEPASVLLERIRAEKGAPSGKRMPKQRQEPDSILELAAIQTGVVQTSLWP